MKGSSRDTLESVFSRLEGSCCPGSSYKPEPTPDTLDFVFDHVESFTCRNEEKEPDVNYDDLLSKEVPSIQRDNSMIVFDKQGRAVTEPFSRTVQRKSEKKDTLDYVFENVERYACNEKMPDDQEFLRKAISPSTGPMSPLNRSMYDRLKVIEEPDEDDEEIQLYFRPKKGPNRQTRRRRKAQCEYQG